jgi:hypothetical protein
VKKIAGIFLLAVFAAAAHAQCCVANIEGHVADQSGADVPGAPILLACKHPAVQAATTTDAKGNFTTTQSSGAECDVTIRVPGFATYRTNVPVLISHVDAVLQIAPTSSPVVVAGYEPLPTQSQAISGSILPNPVADAAHRDWNFGAFVQGGVGLEDRTNFGFFALGLHAAHTMSDELLSGRLKGTAEYGIEAMPLWQSYTPTFQRISCPAGATSAAQCTAPYAVGGTFTGVSFTPIILRYNFTHGTRLMPWVQGAGGVVYTTRKYPAIGNLDYTDPTQTGLNADTSQINFTPQGGVGVHYFLRERRSMDLALNAVHISSASLGDKNPGVNASLQFSIGYSWWK